MSTERTNYSQLSGFENVYLEDSFVLDVKATPGRVTFDLDLVLTPGHPAYRSPNPGEQNCYVRATVEFPEVRHLVWAGQGAPPATDASGDKDYGAIDSLLWNGDAFHLEGDWGEIQVASALPVIRLLD
ncbi:hypothetical protein AB0L99_34415 [Streptomyces sp. NPDC051954]|uniref:hypothetical protein n=1 Tax=unclassified Streptomyces TaxID=2593676 RepID=UPI003449A87A